MNDNGRQQKQEILESSDCLTTWVATIISNNSSFVYQSPQHIMATCTKNFTWKWMISGSNLSHCKCLTPIHANKNISLKYLFW